MLVGERNRVADLNGLLQIGRFVGPQQRQSVLSKVAYAESTSLNTCASAASRSLSLRPMSSCVRAFSPWFRSKMRSGMLTLPPMVSLANGLLKEGLCEYHALKVGSVEPLATARLWIDSWPSPSIAWPPSDRAARPERCCGIPPAAGLAR